MFKSNNNLCFEIINYKFYFYSNYLHYLKYQISINLRKWETNQKPFGRKWGGRMARMGMGGGVMYLLQQWSSSSLLPFLWTTGRPQHPFTKNTVQAFIFKLINILNRLSKWLEKIWIQPNIDKLYGYKLKNSQGKS